LFLGWPLVLPRGHVMSASELITRILALFVAGIAIVALLGACGGGSGTGSTANGINNPGGGGDNTGGSNAVGDNGTGGPPAQQAILNPGVSGKLFMTSPEAYIEFDLATGLSRILRKRDGGMSVSADGQEFALVNARPPDQTVFDRLEELVFFGRDGRQSGRFLKEEGFSNRPLISPDKQTVLVEWHSIDLGDSGGIPVPTAFKRDGTVVKRFTNYGDYTWLPDGRILLTRDDAIYVTSLTAASPTLLKRFPGNTPGALTPSPDGQRLAFAMQDTGRVSEAQTFIMNIDGTGLRQVATSVLGSSPGDFSPDGNSLLLREGSNYFLRGPDFFVAGCPHLFIVPLNVANVVTLDRTAPLPPALKLRGLAEDSGEVTEMVCGFSTPAWRNVPNSDAFVPGASMAGSGLNRGLSGLTYYGFASNLYRTNLMTGETTQLAPAPNTPFPSIDGTEIVFYDRSAALRSQAVVFLDSAGARQRSIDYPESFTGPLKFSPDKTKIAVDWHSIDQGDPGGASIITVFDKNFTRQIARFRDFTDFEWLPDGRLLLSGQNELWIAPASLTAINKIASFSDPINGLAGSRDGQKLAFVMLGNIWTISLSGSDINVTISSPSRLTDSAVLLGRPAFSPDGKTVLVRNQDTIAVQVWAVPADGQHVPVMNVGQSGTSAFPLKTLRDGEQQLMSPSTSVWWR
jgi:Tol biopolymer transport system component